MHKLLCRIAGVDPVTLEHCPTTDRIWASHLGLSLILNFLLVFGLTLYSVGYFLPELHNRLLVALVVASVLTLFDRALFQFDWFTAALLQEVREQYKDQRPRGLHGFLVMARPFWRLALRLLISLAIAYTLSVFVELAAFDNALRERLVAENYLENRPYRDKLAEFEKGLDEQRAAIGRRISSLQDEIAATQKGIVSRTEQAEYDLLRANSADTRARISAIEGTIGENETRIRELNDDIYAERMGLKDKPYRTGKPGCEPGGVCYDLVLTQKELREANTALRRDIERLQVRERELEDKTADLLRRRSAADVEFVASRRQEIERLRSDATALEAQKGAQLANYVAELRRDGTYRTLRDDPMIRIRVLNELRRDPAQGPAISEMSYLIRAFIAFLELAPVLAKIFFAPPTVYSATIRAAVARGQGSALKKEIADLTSFAATVDGVEVHDAQIAKRIEHQPVIADAKLPALDEALTPPPAPSVVATREFGPEDLNDFGVTALRKWINADPQRQRSAGDYYMVNLAQGRLLLDSDWAIADYSRRRFSPQARFFELGCGFGELSLCLALSGFRTVGFESDAGRFAGASALVQALAQHGVDTGKLSLVFGIYPDSFKADAPAAAGDMVFISTNVTSSSIMQSFDEVLHSLRHFNHLIVDLSRFGEVRDLASQQALVAKFQDLGLREAARVYSSGDTDVRHFYRRSRGAVSDGVTMASEPR